MSERFDVIVVGVGAMGASACWELARRGVRVLGLEQFDIPNSRGSSHGVSRMIRLAYYEHPDYVPLLRRAYERWAELETASGQKLLHITGGLYMGRRDSPVISGSLHSAKQHHIDHELLEHAALRERFPQFELPEDHIGMLESQAGFLLCERVISAYVEGSLRRGAVICAHEPVKAWSTSSSGVTVTTHRNEYHADQLIFCGGPWTGKLIEDLGKRLVVTRQVLGWVWPSEPERFTLGTLPVWAIDAPGGGIWYGFPMLADVPGFKIALHKPGSPADVDSVDRSVTAEDEETFRTCLRRHIPQADGPLVAIRTCLYTGSPDGHFLIDRHPDHPRVLLACGFSGHGFKFASVVGEILADYATRGRTDLPADFLKLSRLA